MLKKRSLISFVALSSMLCAMEQNVVKELKTDTTKQPDERSKLIQKISTVTPITETPEYTKVTGELLKQETPTQSVQLSLIFSSQLLSSGKDIANDPVRNQIIVVGDEMPNNTYDYDLEIFDYQGNSKGKLLGHTNIATCFTKLLHDQDHVVSSGLDGQIIVWNLTNNQPDNQITGNWQNLCLLALSDNLIVAGGGDNTGNPSNSLFIWNLQTKQPLACVGHKQIPCVKLTASQLNQWFASNACYGLQGETRVWDYKGNPLSDSLPGGGALGLYTYTNSYRAKIELLVTGNDRINFLDSSDNFNSIYTINDQQNWINILRFSADNIYMISGGQDGRAIIYNPYYDTESGIFVVDKIAICNGHLSPIVDIKILDKPKQNLIATLSNNIVPNFDGSLRIWDFNGNQLCKMSNDNFGSIIRELNPEQTLFAIGSRNNVFIVQMQVNDEENVKKEDEEINKTAGQYKCNMQ